MAPSAMIGQSFSRDERLRRSEDITRLLDTGARLGRNGLYLLYRDGADRTRAAFIVKRRLGPAPLRNLMKRRMRECYRTSKARLRPGLSLVFSANRVMNYPGVRESMDWLLCTSGLRSEEAKPPRG